MSTWSILPQLEIGRYYDEKVESEKPAVTGKSGIKPRTPCLRSQCSAAA